MNLDELVANALAEIDEMTTDELKAEFLEAGFELIPNYAQSGEAQVAVMKEKVLYNERYTPVLKIQQTYDSFSASCNDSCYCSDLLVA